jgi:acyl-CoA reductase-like NAD-dependent aldehyde dehydrogenase
MVMQSINPATEEVLESYTEFSTSQVDTALQQVYDRQKQWRTTSFAERAAGLKALAGVLRSDKARFAGKITA